MKFNAETPTSGVKMQGEIFLVPKPYQEGHPLTAGEASVMNQTLAENTRNNFADRIKKAKDNDELDVKKMQAEIDEYLEGYEFGIRRGRGPTDPVEREALNIAKELVRTALREKGHKLADVDSDDINRLAEDAIAANASITKEAKRRVEARSNITTGALNLNLGNIGAGDEGDEASA